MKLLGNIVAAGLAKSLQCGKRGVGVKTQCPWLARVKLESHHCFFRKEEDNESYLFLRFTAKLRKEQLRDIIEEAFVKLTFRDAAYVREQMQIFTRIAQIFPVAMRNNRKYRRVMVVIKPEFTKVILSKL